MREEDIDYLNEARPDYAGFVFAKSKKQLSPAQGEQLRSHLSEDIVPVGVFVDAPIAEVSGLYRNGIISIAQLHGTEDEEYIVRLKEECGIPVIKVYIKGIGMAFRRLSMPPIQKDNKQQPPVQTLPDYYLFDSGAGSGKVFDWSALENLKIDKPWFLAGGINVDNIGQAMTLNPFGIDLSSGAETDGLKDRKKILQLTNTVRNYK